MLKTRASAKKDTLTIKIRPRAFQTQKLDPPAYQNINIDINRTEKVPCGVLTIRCQGTPIEGGQLCSVCRDGVGLLFTCSECSIRSFCTGCIDATNGATFVCPNCHIFKDDPHRKHPKPYNSNVKRTIPTRELWPVLCVEPLAVFCIKLEGIPSEGNPAYLVYQSLWSYFRGNICYIEFDFNLTTGGSVSLAERLSKVFEEFNNGAFTTRILIFLYAHPIGNAHTGTCCQTSDKILDNLFPQPFQNILHRHDKNVLFVLSCGSTFKNEKGLMELENFRKMRLFQQVISFTSPEFVPAIGLEFYTTFAYNQFVCLNENIVTSLNGCDGLGACTDVVVMRDDKALKSYVIKQYTWSRPASKPFGIPIDHQCGTCKALRTFKVRKAGADKITLRCSKCLTTEDHQRPSGLGYCRRNGEGYNKDNDPEWMEHTLN